MFRRILLIDDDRMQLRIAQAYFKEFLAEDYELDWAATYEAGLEKLVGGDYAACLLDYELGPRNGLQLFREAKSRGCHVPTVLLTASEETDEEASEAGVFVFLEKNELLKNRRALKRALVYALKLGDLFGELRRRATRDELTGLLNRRELDRILAEETERSIRFGQPLALVMLDLDHFKTVNDTHGHPAGDVVLREAAGRLARMVRSVDRVARFGGEEFALVLVQTDRAGALEVARRACAALARAPVELPGGVMLNVTTSAGVAAMPADAVGGEALVAAADKALYAAKQRGRNRAVGFDELEREGDPRPPAS